jgi:hypothetical protein
MDEHDGALSPDAGAGNVRRHADDRGLMLLIEIVLPATLGSVNRRQHDN